MEKLEISKSIVAAIREQKGRFLKEGDAKGTWYDIGNKKATEKTSQALRDAALLESLQMDSSPNTSEMTPPAQLYDMMSQQLSLSDFQEDSVLCLRPSKLGIDSSARSFMSDFSDYGMRDSGTSLDDIDLPAAPSASSAVEYSQDSVQWCHIFITIMFRDNCRSLCSCILHGIGIGDHNSNRARHWTFITPSVIPGHPCFVPGNICLSFL